MGLVDSRSLNVNHTLKFCESLNFTVKFSLATAKIAAHTEQTKSKEKDLYCHLICATLPKNHTEFYVCHIQQSVLEARACLIEHDISFYVRIMIFYHSSLPLSVSSSLSRLWWLVERFTLQRYTKI